MVVDFVCDGSISGYDAPKLGWGNKHLSSLAEAEGCQIPQLARTRHVHSIRRTEGWADCRG